MDDPDGLTKQFTYIKPEVPAGYEVIYEDKVEGQQYSIIYQNEEGEEISYLQTGDIEGLGLGLDKETGDLQETKVNGYKGYAYSSNDNNSLIWSNGTYLFSCRRNLLYGGHQGNGGENILRQYFLCYKKPPSRLI